MPCGSPHASPQYVQAASPTYSEIGRPKTRWKSSSRSSLSAGRGRSVQLYGPNTSIIPGVDRSNTEDVQRQAPGLVIGTFAVDRNQAEMLQLFRGSLEGPFADRQSQRPPLTMAVHQADPEKIRDRSAYLSPASYSDTV